MQRNGATLRAYVPLGLLERIDTIADDECTSRSAVTRRLLLDALRRDVRESYGDLSSEVPDGAA